MPTASRLSPATFSFISTLIRSAAALLRPAQFRQQVRLSALGASVAFGALCAFSPYASGQSGSIGPNQPIGEAQGVFPGRVVWVHDPTAVNQNCVVNTPGAAWYLPVNNNQTVIDGMVSTALRGLTGQTDDLAAWTAIFKFHNAALGKGTVNYAPGEIIFIKINATSAWAGNFDTTDLTPNITPRPPTPLSPKPGCGSRSCPFSGNW